MRGRKRSDAIMVLKQSLNGYTVRMYKRNKNKEKTLLVWKLRTYIVLSISSLFLKIGSDFFSIVNFVSSKNSRILLLLLNICENAHVNLKKIWLSIMFVWVIHLLPFPFSVPLLIQNSHIYIKDCKWYITAQSKYVLFLYCSFVSYCIEWNVLNDEQFFQLNSHNYEWTALVSLSLFAYVLHHGFPDWN